MTNKPYSQSCENNKHPILDVIKSVFSKPCTIWEIGSGTGQHACYFAEQLPHLVWQPTDRIENLPGIRLWQAAAKLINLRPPLPLDVRDKIWPCQSIDGLFTANTLHIMSAEEVQICFARVGEYLNPLATICIYGPFNYNQTYTSESNARFDQWLKNQNPLSGIKNFEDIKLFAAQIGCDLIQDVSMPANNRLLVLQKKTAKI